jgi:hypothetical protein
MGRRKPMDEARWLACAEPAVMLRFVRGQVSARKLGLFAVACCRRVERLMADERSRTAVDVAERRADGLATEREVRAARAAARAADDVARSAYLDADASDRPPYGYGPLYAACMATGAAATVLYVDANVPASLAAHARAGEVCGYASKEATDEAFRAADRAALAETAGLLREVVGNPFRPVAVDPTWRATSVVALARSIYEDRRWEDMPFLADALEEAGCGDEGMLSHCRSGTHTRGCGVVDLLLGKA